MNSIDDVAMVMLGNLEKTFNEVLLKYPYRYREWFLLDKLRSHSRPLIDKLFQYSHSFPQIHALLHNCREYIGSDFEQVFPSATQRTINELSKIALELQLRPGVGLTMSFISLSERFTAPYSACSYYKDAERAFNACASLVAIYGSDSKEGSKALSIASNIIARADMTSAPAIDRLLLLAEQENATPDKARELFLMSLIGKQENHSFELKETLSFDVKNNSKENNGKIEASALKAVASFLNTEGGILLIGVSDNGVVQGLDHDLLKFNSGSYDKLMQRWQSIIFSRLGEQAKVSVRSDFVELDGKPVLCAECSRAGKPIYIDGKLYIRVFARCELLGNEVLEGYLKDHFSI